LIASGGHGQANDAEPHKLTLAAWLSIICLIVHDDLHDRAEPRPDDTRNSSAAAECIVDGRCYPADAPDARRAGRSVAPILDPALRQLSPRGRTSIASTVAPFRRRHARSGSGSSPSLCSYLGRRGCCHPPASRRDDGRSRARTRDSTTEAIGLSGRRQLLGKDLRERNHRLRGYRRSDCGSGIGRDLPDGDVG
jgi:hypothetical protein